MKRTTVYLEEGVDLALSQIAKRRGRAKAELIRESLAALIEREQKAVVEMPSWVGAGDSGGGGYGYAGRDDELLLELLEAGHEAALASYDEAQRRKAER